MEDMLASSRGAGQGEVLGIPCTEELESELHDFLAGKFGTGKIIEDEFAVLGEEGTTFSNTVYVR